MPKKPLPPELIKRLKKAVSKIDSRLGKMNNMDWRIQRKHFAGNKYTFWAGSRVREMNISRNYPEKTAKGKLKTELVLKRDDVRNAGKTIKLIKKAVQKHNKGFGKKDYVLLEPIAYPISKEIIAMSKINAPSIYEILNTQNLSAKQLLNKLEQKHGIKKKHIMHAWGKLKERINIEERNMLLIGYKNKKFVFMPLVDIR